jgi:hypothetical protein
MTSYEKDPIVRLFWHKNLKDPEDTLKSSKFPRFYPQMVDGLNLM